MSEKGGQSLPQKIEVMTYERNFKFNFFHITYDFINNYNDKAITASVLEKAVKFLSSLQDYPPFKRSSCFYYILKQIKNQLLKIKIFRKKAFKK